MAAKFLCVFVLDRFGDFVSDQVFRCLLREIINGYSFVFHVGSSAGPRNSIPNVGITVAAHAPPVTTTRTCHTSPDDSAGLSDSGARQKFQGQ